MPCWLFANIDVFREAARHMQRSGSWGSNGFLLAAIAVILLFWAGLSWVEKLRKQRIAERKSPEGLFHELCRVHQLSRAQRTLLADAAPSPGPADLARLFVDPTILGRLAASNNPQAGEYASLLTRLFGEPASESAR